MTEPFPIPLPGAPLHFGAASAPLVVLLHDWFGRLPGIERYAEALARVGFRVVVPDLYDGVATDDADVARSLMDQLDVATGLAAIDDVILEARGQGSRRVGTVGFSMGGWLALLHAQGGAIDAVAAYYATLGSSEHGVIPCPVLLNFAETDEWGESEDPESFVGRLREHGTPVTEFSYLGTVHSFANASMPDTFDANAAALAFARTTAFFEDQLAD
jgi:carboxymethylenebutenolidase